MNTSGLLGLTASLVPVDGHKEGNESQGASSIGNFCVCWLTPKENESGGASNLDTRKERESMSKQHEHFWCLLVHHKGTRLRL